MYSVLGTFFFYFSLFFAKNIRLFAVFLRFWWCWFLFYEVFCTHNTTHFIEANLCGALDDVTIQMNISSLHLFFLRSILQYSPLYLRKLIERVCVGLTQKTSEFKGEEDVKLWLF